MIYYLPVNTGPKKINGQTRLLKKKIVLIFWREKDYTVRYLVSLPWQPAPVKEY
jgi:hypothetical protein